MMKQYVVDAFSDAVFHGNQAAVCGGTLYCRQDGTRLFISGKAALYSIGELFVGL